MKRSLLLILLILVLLAGCAMKKPEQTQPSTTQATTEPPAATTAPSLLDSDNAIVKATNGALLALSLEEGECYFTFMGEKPLLFYYEGDAATRLIRLETDGYTPELTLEIPGTVCPGSVGFRATAKNLGYYSETENAVVVLDAMFREVTWTAMPEELKKPPLISLDMECAWYADGTELRVIDLDTGISRILRQRDCAYISLERTVFNDQILVCIVCLEDGTLITEFISAESGETLGSDKGFVGLNSWEDRYFLFREEASIQEYLFGTGEEAIGSFFPHEDTMVLHPVMELNAVVGISWEEGKSRLLRLYDLESGKMVSSVRVPDMGTIQEITGDPAGRYIWFFGVNSAQEMGLYRWDTEATPQRDETIYTAPRYTQKNPDIQGLAQCRERADALEEAYGIRLHLQEDIPAAENYTFDFEFQPRAYHLAMDQLEVLLAQFPEDFFRTLGNVSEDGKVHIGLVRDLQSRTGNAVPNAAGIQYWQDSNTCMTLKITTSMSNAFYHQLALVMDTFILNEALAYDDWSKLNPKGFQYDGNYSAYLTREDLSLAEGENRVFLDAFSMTYPKEDRAAVFAAAMDPYAADAFDAPVLQQKLIQVCKGIRDAFGLKKDSRSFPWEQYLEKSLAYTKK